METPEQKAAFEYWFNEGNRRKCQEVAAHFRRRPQTIKAWRKEFQWVSRAERRMEKVGKAVNKRMIKSLAEQRSQLTRILDMSLDQLEEALKEGKVRWSSTDLERLVKLRLLTLGDHTEAIKHEFASYSDTDLIKEAEAILAGALKRGSKEE